MCAREMRCNVLDPVVRERSQITVPDMDGIEALVLVRAGVRGPNVHNDVISPLPARPFPPTPIASLQPLTRPVCVAARQKME